MLTYTVNNDKHRLVINGITFADFGEVTGSEDMTADQRLLFLNRHDPELNAGIDLAADPEKT
jgi:hypothetical protein